MWKNPATPSAHGRPIALGAFRSGPTGPRPSRTGPLSQTGPGAGHLGAPVAASYTANPGFETVTSTGALTPSFPAASYAWATSVWGPFPATSVSQAAVNGAAESAAT